MFAFLRYSISPHPIGRKNFLDKTDVNHVLAEGKNILVLVLTASVIKLKMSDLQWRPTPCHFLQNQNHLDMMSDKDYLMFMITLTRVLYMTVIVLALS